MKNMKLTMSTLLLFILLFCGFNDAIRACDVSTYVAMLNAEKTRLKAIPERKTSKDLVIGYTEGTKYLAQSLALFFEKKNADFSVFPKELININPDPLHDRTPLTPKGTEEGPELPEITPWIGKKTDIVILPILLNPDNKLLHSVSDWAVTFAKDEIILVFGGSGKHKEAMKELTWKEIIENQDYKMIIATEENTCLSHYTKELLSRLNTATPVDSVKSGEILQKKQIKRESMGNTISVETAKEVIEKVVKGEADFGLIYKSVATIYAMLTKKLPEHINQQDAISYGFAIKRNSPNYSSASLFAESMLNTEGFLKLKTIGFTPISGGEISFKTK